MAGTLKKLTVVSERYPSPGEPVFTFVDDLVSALAELGVEVTVISPQSATRVLVRGGKRTPLRQVRHTSGGAQFTLIQPWYLTFSGIFSILGRKSYRRAVRRIAAKLPAPDAYYAHFWHSGVATALCKGDRPVFVACGESRVKADLAGDVRSISRAIGGVISVSGQNKADCVRLYGLPEDDIVVLPNAVDERLFHRRDDREAIRAVLSLGPQDFVVAFVGWFDERKGVKRVEAALSGLSNVKVIYIGHGELTPAGDNIAFSGRVEHDDVPRYLNAADAFVLPTRAEGCCNAIVEAMACGLPVISSTGAFNDDLLSPDNAIRIDPDDVKAIRNAVLTLQNDVEKTRAMGEAALRFARELTVKRRAEHVKAFIESRL